MKVLTLETSDIRAVIAHLKAETAQLKPLLKERKIHTDKIYAGPKVVIRESTFQPTTPSPSGGVSRNML